MLEQRRANVRIERTVEQPCRVHVVRVRRRSLFWCVRARGDAVFEHWKRSANVLGERTMGHGGGMLEPSVRQRSVRGRLHAGSETV
jgi:hypothetical protein